MRYRNFAASLGVACAVLAAPVMAQTVLVYPAPTTPDPLPRDNVVILVPQSSPEMSMSGMHYENDQYGRQIVVDDAYASPQARRQSTFNPMVDSVTGTVTAPGYMGPRDVTGQ